MSAKTDDLKAVRLLADTLQPFAGEDRERIIRWAREKLGMTATAAPAIAPRTDVFISPYLLHRHPEFWSEPEEFRPERFAGADAEERHKFAYIPFSVGPRHCIGENLALFEMLGHVSMMSRRFRMTRVGNDPIELEAQINLRPRSNLMMHVEVR